jgi:hypothetical protein
VETKKFPDGIAVRWDVGGIHRIKGTLTNEAPSEFRESPLAANATKFILAREITLIKSASTETESTDECAEHSSSNNKASNVTTAKTQNDSSAYNNIFTNEQKAWTKAVEEGRPDAFRKFYKKYPKASQIKVVIADVKTDLTRFETGIPGALMNISVEGHPELSGDHPAHEICPEWFFKVTPCEHDYETGLLARKEYENVQGSELKKAKLLVAVIDGKECIVDIYSAKSKKLGQKYDR